MFSMCRTFQPIIPYSSVKRIHWNKSYMHKIFMMLLNIPLCFMFTFLVNNHNIKARLSTFLHEKTFRSSRSPKTTNQLETNPLPDLVECLPCYNLLKFRKTIMNCGGTLSRYLMIWILHMSHNINKVSFLHAWPISPIHNVSEYVQ